MFSNYDMFHFCLNCSSSFSLKEYETIKIKSFIFSLGSNKIKCPVCKTKDNFIELTPKWSTLISKLNEKGYDVLNCSMFDNKNNSHCAYIKFQNPIKSSIKPKFMSYDSQWSIEDSSIIKKDEDFRVLLYIYSEEKNYFVEYQKLTQNLLKWVENI